MPEKLLTLHSLVYKIPQSVLSSSIPTLLVPLIHYSCLCLSPLQLLPKLTGKPRHSRLWRIFKGQRLLHVYVVSLEESRQGERGGTKTFRNFTQFLIRWEGERKDCLGRLFLVNMGPSKWKKQNTTFLEKRKYDQIPYLKGPMLSLNVTTLG